MRLALFQPDIPQNLGAAMRLGACLGVPLEVVEPCGFPLSDPALRRAAMDYGGIGEVVRRRSWTDFLAAPEREAGKLVLFTTRGALPLHEYDFSAGDTLLFGRESAGAPDEVHEAAQARLFIPLVPAARSLNVVTAAAIAVSEALRQTGGFPKPTAS
ncbi:tRNA (cytidine(34)-2'-O)-methyltransferase [Phenylobacterium sp.]|jgi:tRNA (cytidine/uridine-2'-O-)-methyltransferase|uniref:tRNA (cytidine(34)-2'-O)-methyltransferase n=1 Tax=Phenylobacterium sp. TaxID=1871053 RepID=UPI002E35D168|nr:tRNA (cytidine(34)-2'-O)-methyltransferase [Phenylobacterium sp.]HEX2561928.1 tRNA (cytidine(34)-2'-O)-methyltransferase [Phenylobacterium sp.]